MYLICPEIGTSINNPSLRWYAWILVYFLQNLCSLYRNLDSFDDSILQNTCVREIIILCTRNPESYNFDICNIIQYTL